MTKSNPTLTPAQYFTTLRMFNRDVRLFFLMAVIFGITNMGGIFAAIFNLFLLRLGYGTDFIGRVSAVGSLVVVFFCLPASALERRFGSRKLILAGLCLNILSCFLIPFAGLLPAQSAASFDWRSTWVLVTYAFNSFSLAIYLVGTQPFLAGATTPVERGHVFSVQAAFWPLSGFAGSLLGGMIPGLVARFLGTSLSGPQPYQITLWISTALSIFALFAMLRTRQAVAEEQAAADVPTRSLGIPISSPARIIAILSLVIAFQVTSEAAARTFTNVYLDKALQLPTSGIGLVLGLGQFVAALGALLTPFFAGRFGKERTYVVASLGVALFILPLALIPSWFGAGLGFMGVTMMGQIARPAVITIQMESVTPAYRSAMAAITTMAASLSMGLMSLLGGYMIPAFGYAAFFLTGAGLTSLAAIGFAMYLSVKQSKIGTSN